MHLALKSLSSVKDHIFIFYSVGDQSGNKTLNLCWMGIHEQGRQLLEITYFSLTSVFPILMLDSSEIGCVPMFLSLLLILLRYYPRADFCILYIT